MKRTHAGLALVAVQAVLVLTTWGKYEWERHTRPMVWTQAKAWDENGPLPDASVERTRYQRVQLLADVCGLPPKAPQMEDDYAGVKDPSHPKTYPTRKERIRVVAQNGHLVAAATDQIAERGTEEMLWDMRQPCTQGRLLDFVDLYVPAGSGINPPLRRKPGQTIWALVTVPEQGPPRPVELAISDSTGFHPLKAK